MLQSAVACQTEPLQNEVHRVHLDMPVSVGKMTPSAEIQSVTACAHLVLVEHSLKSGALASSKGLVSVVVAAVVTGVAVEGAVHANNQLHPSPSSQLNCCL